MNTVIYAKPNDSRTLSCLNLGMRPEVVAETDRYFFDLSKRLVHNYSILIFLDNCEDSLRMRDLE